MNGESLSFAILDGPKIISPPSGYYHGWATVARLRDGRLFLVCSGGRQAHVCPFGRIELMISHDGGASWTWPRVVMDSAIDDRDAGILELSGGEILISYFSSLAYLKVRDEQLTEEFLLTPSEWELWPKVSQRITAGEQQKEADDWLLISRDGGVNWSAKQGSPVSSPHGPLEADNGRIVYVGRAREGDRLTVWESTDAGSNWKQISEIGPHGDEDAGRYYEPHAVKTKSGRLVAHIRSHAHPKACNEIPHWIATLQTESDDGGYHWTEPHPVGYYGYPSHLLCLADGRLLVTYGHRIAPFGIQARISDDEGQSWSAPFLLTQDGASFDLGYPSTIEREDGALVTIWYERLRSSPKAILRQLIWRPTIN